MKGKNKNRSPRLLRDLLRKLKDFLRPRPEPEDPYAYRMAPLRRPPHNRGAAAVAELDEK